MCFLNFFPALVEGYVCLKQKFISYNQCFLFRRCLKKCQKNINISI